MGLIVSIVSWLLGLLSLAIFIRALLSWFMQVGADPFTRLLVDITDPILLPIRNFMQRILPMPLDLSPMVAIILLQILQSMLARAY